MALGLALLALGLMSIRVQPPSQGPTVGEKLSTLEGERGALQARADGEARISLLSAFRTASFLTDALIVRLPDRERAFEGLPELPSRAFAAIDALNLALNEAVVRPGKGARQAVTAVAQAAQDALDHLAGDGQPLVLQASPRFVPPRPAAGEQALALPGTITIPAAAAILLPAGARNSPGARTDVPIVPRYVPSFVPHAVYDPPVAVEIAATGFEDADRPPTLAVGDWKAEMQVSPLGLRASVPRSAFASEALRTTFATGLLSVRRDGRVDTFHVPFVVLPDRPGSFAFDQKVRTLMPEANILVSPEILVRAETGKASLLRRCFDPPPGQHFDKSQRRIVTVERLGWHGDESDPSLNEGTMEFARDEKPDQICVILTAKPADKDARTATIGRFEATLVQQAAQDQAASSGVRSLDWNHEVRVPIDLKTVEGKLYVQLLGEIDLEYNRLPSDKAPAMVIPFLRISREGGDLVLRADSSAGP